MIDKIKPNWAGEDWLSRFVNLLIQTRPIYAIMKRQARQVMIKNAEKNGIPWRQTYQELETSGVKEQLAETTDERIVYPDYYKMPFHAYPEGNLCWPAAFEAESATYTIGLRTWPQEDLTWEAGQNRLRSSFHQVLAEYGPAQVRDILDIGCSVGISTLALHRFYEKTQAAQMRTVGLDLSPYMLAVAKMRDGKGEIAEWIHAKGEDTGLPDAAFDLVTLQYLIHELPNWATQDIFREALRLLRTGGVLAIVDNDPKSPVIQNLSPVRFTLLKSTEPWSDEYYTFNVEAALEAIGFDHLVTVASDPRHRTIIGKKSD